MPDFPHMRETPFPHLNNIDVYKYQNEFDYSRYDDTQMHITLCSVPWDMGEAHIGARTISGIGNVVWFETEEKRDKWFEAIPDKDCYRFDTKYKELHRDNQITVAIPFDVASTYNYLMVEYEPFTSEGNPVQYERPGGIDKWFWFVREVEFLAPNSTRLHLLNDAFQTFMYRMHFSGMILERGHAPMLDIDVNTYLSNPVANNAGLLAEDVNFGNIPSVAKRYQAHVFNDDVYACIVSSATPSATWGSKGADTWHTPTTPYNQVNGIPGFRMFAMETGDFNDFLSNMQDTCPQFAQTVKGVFFAPKELVTLGSKFTFCGTSCHYVATSQKTLDFVTLNKGMFGYPSRYADIAKLYTYPYAAIELTDEQGNVSEIHVEDTTGKLQISAALSLAYPAISLHAHVLGAGGSTRGNLAFVNLNERSLTIGGRWYESLRTWGVPIFGIIQSGAKRNDYATHFDREQSVVAYTNSYDSAVASADTALANANASADTAQTNANASADTALANANASADTAKTNTDAGADTLVANTAIQTAANTAITSRSNQAALSDASLANALSQALQAWESGYARQTANNEVDAAYASAAIGAAGGAIGSAASGAMSGASLGPAGAAAGAIGGLVSGAISGVTTMAQTAVAANLTTTQAEATVSLSQNKVSESSRNNTDRTTNQNSANSDNVSTSNTASTGASANSAATEKANATRNQTTQKANATRTNTTDKANASRSNTTDKANAARTNTTDKANAGRARNTSINAIDNSVSQHALDAPFEFGEFSNTGSAPVKPQALIANIITQSASAIKQAGDEFLRYGYMYEQQYDFDGNWNKGRYFTYWKLRDFWVTNLSIPDMYVDKLRFFLFGGVTVWRRPEDIGNVTIYENM